MVNTMFRCSHTIVVVIYVMKCWEDSQSIVHVYDSNPSGVQWLILELGGAAISQLFRNVTNPKLHSADMYLRSEMH